ncbi:MAG TPA: hypothetical protein VGO91_19705 [Pyrinomonadaceae bacterium]|nr:hypothetical protein [Pyrinomonadaceae bacterium]
MRSLIHNLEDHTNQFRSTVDTTLDRSRIDGTRAEDNINTFVSDFQDAVHRLHERFDNRQATTTDVQDVLNRSTRINNFLQRRQLDARINNDWSSVRSDLSELARVYGVSYRQDNVRNYPPVNGGNQGNQGNTGYGYGSNRLSGTYRLDATRSDDPRDAAQRATQNLPINNRQRVLDNLTARLESPDQIAIDRRGRTVTIASTRAPQITFDANGQESVETTANGRTVRARATLTGDQLIVNSTGNNGNDYSVTFTPIDNGQRLNVTRRIINQNLSRPVVVQSIYEKTSAAAQFNIYNGPQDYPNNSGNGGYGTGTGNGNGTTSGDYAVPNGTSIIARLDTNLTTATARDGDRFTMTVRDPSQYQGAIIEGTISNVARSGRATGRSQMTLNFDSIRLRDGGTYRFAGVVQNVRSNNGDNVRVDNEGSVRDDSQTTKTEQRAAIGTAVGAIIGAIAGGGKGAVIGGILGAGGGAGSVYAQGRNDLELMTGSEVTIVSSAPR